MVLYNVVECATQYGKHDMERLGIFIEMPYMNGKGYVSPFPKLKGDKGRNMMCPRYQFKNGTMHGYFDDEFRRLFEGEAIPKAKKRKSEDKAKVKVPFVPAGSTKWHACPGDFHGTFRGKVEAFSPAKKKVPPRQKQHPNCLTNPGKKGGPGYANICLSKYPEYKSSPYKAKPKIKAYGTNLAGPILTVHFPQPFFDKNPFFEEKHGRVYVPPKEKPPTIVGDGKWIPTNPAKRKGGCDAGLFSTFEYKTNRDRRKEAKLKREKNEEKGSGSDC